VDLRADEPNLFLEDRSALPDQISFGLTFPWARLVLAMRYGDRADKYEIAIFVFGVPANDFPHEMLQPTERWVYITCILIYDDSQTLVSVSVPR
jgi:hypothetical protein